ncbi:hypothetical protein A9266_12905 [Vibrio tasmaniensis]|nr:hypothetical protein A9266_12905 [Vibrio tasmaniensis]
MNNLLSDPKLAAIGTHCFVLGIPHIKVHPTNYKGSKVLEALKLAVNTGCAEDLDRARELITQYNY